MFRPVMLVVFVVFALFVVLVLFVAFVTVVVLVLFVLNRVRTQGIELGAESSTELGNELGTLGP